jgi:hypothetical protein
MAKEVIWSEGKPGMEGVLLGFEANTAAYSGRLTRARELSSRAVASAQRVGDDETAADDEVEAALREVATKTNAGQRLIELNAVATAAVTKLYSRAHSQGATEPSHYLLPADLSRHTQKSDPLKGKRGFDVTRHQESWRTAWRNLRETAAKAIENAAIEENRELTSEERKTIALFKALRFHTLRHYAESRNMPNADFTMASCADLRINDSA